MANNQSSDYLLKLTIRFMGSPQTVRKLYQCRHRKNIGSRQDVELEIVLRNIVSAYTTHLVVSVQRPLMTNVSLTPRITKEVAVNQDVGTVDS